MLVKGKLYQTYNSQAFYFNKNTNIWTPIKRNSIYFYLGNKQFYVNYIITKQILFCVVKTTATGYIWFKNNRWNTVYELSKEFIEIK